MTDNTLKILVASSMWMAVLGVQTALDAVAAQKAPTSVNDGVYSAAQATRGQAIFEGSCTTCHDTTKFMGSEFLSAWAGKPLRELFEVMSTTMPEDSPGSLKPQEYADVIAYFLKLNQFPSGSSDLKGAADSMAAIKFEKQGR
jgi:S-disulfanyl-L-cysteine oxidoreductase SoxD